MMKARDAVALDIGRALSTITDSVFDSQAFARFTEADDPADPEPERTGQEPKFRNRERELEEVTSALNNDDASHFWFFVAPPQLGKTWFLRETGKRLRKLRTRCVVHEVDVRRTDTDTNDALALLARMYGVSGPAPDARAIASAISGTHKYNLCLLDNAESLSEETIRELRRGLEEIDQRVRTAKSRGTRLALVAASRQDDAWRGVAPLRLSIRNLTEFRVDVVLEALCDLASDMDKEHTRAELRPLADQVHRLSEGLPALLSGYLAWIQRADWVDLDRLANRDCFDEIATPYIEGDLLSPGSLYGRKPDQPDELRTALIETLRVLAPYRYFTGSHLSHYAKTGSLRDALVRLKWNEERLGDAVSRTDVLLLPQDELWNAIAPPIRRLLFRHWYGSADGRVRAHRAALEFLETYAQSLTGTERVEAVIECLWHEAEALSLSRDAPKTEPLTDLAERLSADLAGSIGPAPVIVPRFRDREIRNFACRRMRDDEELVRAVGDGALFEAITTIMEHPNGGNMS
jgi:hypothetical protein